MLYSCANDESEKMALTIDYDQIGSDHNHGLEYVFQTIKEGIEEDPNFKESNLSSADCALKFCQKKTNEFLTEYCYSTKKHSHLATQMSKQGFSTAFNKSRLKTKNKNLWNPEDDSKLSSKQKSFLDELGELILNSDLDKKTKLKKISDIKKKQIKHFQKMNLK